MKKLLRIIYIIPLLELLILMLMVLIRTNYTIHSKLGYILIQLLVVEAILFFKRKIFNPKEYKLISITYLGLILSIIVFVIYFAFVFIHNFEDSAFIYKIQTISDLLF